MDYEYTVDEFGQLSAQFSIGYEALGLWFNEELCFDKEKISNLLNQTNLLEKRKIQPFHIDGKEFQLRVSGEGVEVVALALGIEVYEELPESTNLYDQESYSECGLQDFIQALKMWQDFVLVHKP